MKNTLNNSRLDAVIVVRDVNAPISLASGAAQSSATQAHQGHPSDHVTTRQYSRLVDTWVALAALNPAAYGTHSMRRTKVALVYKRSGISGPGPFNALLQAMSALLPETRSPRVENMKGLS